MSSILVAGGIQDPNVTAVLEGLAWRHHARPHPESRIFRIQTDALDYRATRDLEIERLDDLPQEVDLTIQRLIYTKCSAPICAVFPELVLRSYQRLDAFGEDPAVVIDVFLAGVRGYQGHIVKGGHEDVAVEGGQMHVPVQLIIDGRGRF